MDGKKSGKGGIDLDDFFARVGLGDLPPEAMREIMGKMFPRMSDMGISGTSSGEGLPKAIVIVQKAFDQCDQGHGHEANGCPCCGRSADEADREKAGKSLFETAFMAEIAKHLDYSKVRKVSANEQAGVNQGGHGYHVRTVSFQFRGSE